MVVGNETKSVTLAPYYPATLNPSFMGAHPPTRYDLPYDSGAQRVTYFQNYRNETLSRFLMPPYDWGVQKSGYSPKPDIVAGVKGRNLDRLLAVPFNDIETIDSMRLKETDDFYKAVQMHRDQYKDRTGVLHPLKYFRPDDSAFNGPPGLFGAYMSKYPDTYTAHKLPIVLPITYERRVKTPYLPELSLAGIYSRRQCIAHKV